MNKKLRANLLLFGVAVIWGFGFVATDRGAELLEPVTFNALRMALAGLSLLPILWWQQRRGQRSTTQSWYAWVRPPSHG